MVVAAMVRTESVKLAPRRRVPSDAGTGPCQEQTGIRARGSQVAGAGNLANHANFTPSRPEGRRCQEEQCE